mmetsp:Transcript_15905/g.34337  ORF Transcript_15905/g.34337 Transcript_15905/m.34337 type:complete len:93 (+) Transcript_15905:933-1211(+)
MIAFGVSMRLERWALLGSSFIALLLPFTTARLPRVLSLEKEVIDLPAFDAQRGRLEGRYVDLRTPPDTLKYLPPPTRRFLKALPASSNNFPS